MPHSESMAKAMIQAHEAGEGSLPDLIRKPVFRGMPYRDRRAVIEQLSTYKDPGYERPTLAQKAKAMIGPSLAAALTTVAAPVAGNLLNSAITNGFKGPLVRESLKNIRKGTPLLLGAGAIAGGLAATGRYLLSKQQEHADVSMIEGLKSIQNADDKDVAIDRFMLTGVTPEVSPRDTMTAMKAIISPATKTVVDEATSMNKDNLDTLAQEYSDIHAKSQEDINELYDKYDDNPPSELVNKIREQASDEMAKRHSVLEKHNYPGAN